MEDGLCGPCAGLDIHGAVERLFSQENAQVGDSYSLGSPWHNTLADVHASSSACALCRIIMKGWQSSREVVVEEAILNADFDPTDPPPGLNDPVGQIAAYRNAPGVTLEVVRRLRTVDDGRKNKYSVFLQVECGQEEQTSFDVLDRVTAELRITRDNHGHIIEDASDTESGKMELDTDSPVHADPLSQESLEVARGWLETCVNNHGEACGHSAGAGKWLPTRLLEVEFASGQMYLRVADPSEPFKDARYVALSHCWGQGGTPFTTTHATLHLRKEGIDIDTLPQTFRDSAALTNSLGLRYIWIDSLCIIQDDAKDWAYQAAQMAKVYRNAHLVLNAANSDADSTGFLRPRNPQDTVLLPSTPTGRHTLHLQLLPPPGRRWTDPSGPDPLTNEPISTRAWCLQERSLPVRSLHYASHQTFWECERMRASEDGDAIPQPSGGGHLQRLCRTANTTTTHSVFSRPGDDRDPASESESAVNWVDWYRMVEDYTARSITKHADRFPALSGLAEAIMRETSGGGGDLEYLRGLPYVAGLWRSGLLEGLIWCRARPGQALSPTPEYVAPSWSWASVTGGGVQFPVYTWYARRAQGKARMADFEALAEYVDRQIMPASGNAYGAVSVGLLVLRAPLLEVVAVGERQGRAPELRALFGQGPGRSEVGDIVVKMRVPEGGVIWIEGGFDCPGVAVDAANLFVVFLTRLPHVLEEGFVEHRFGLILEKRDSYSYRRVGFIDGVILKKSMLDAVRGRGMFSIAGYPRPYKKDDTYEVVRHNELASDPLMLDKAKVMIF